MAARDVCQRPVDAGGFVVSNLGEPQARGDATFTDIASAPRAIARAAAPGKSLLAAPADHEHASPAPLRIAASGKTTVAAGARVTLATIKRDGKELFAPGGYVYIKDDRDGATWESEVNGASHIATYHERTGIEDEVRFCAVNASPSAHTIEWATLALAMPQ